MGVFRRKARDAIFGPDPIQIERVADPASPEPTDPDPANLQPPDPDPNAIKVARTLVKSEPELAELVAAEPRFDTEGIEVSLLEKGFGTRVEIRATPASGLAQTDLEGLLDSLAEPQKRPFSAS